MDFKEYYKDKGVVSSYDYLRAKGIKAWIVRLLELRFVDLLVENKKQKILEIGVGTGFISRLLVKKGKFYGMDISQEMLDKASEILKHAKLIKGDILTKKIKDKFDTVVTVRVISHFNKKDAIRALENIAKILNKHGEVVFNLENRSLIRRIARKLTKWGSTKTYQYSRKGVFEIAKQANLRVEKILYLDHLFILPLHIINKIACNKLENFILNIEIGLKETPFMSSNFFIKCRK